MVVVSAVIGGVAGTVSTINTVKTWVEELQKFLRSAREAGLTLQRLKISLSEAETDLGIWMKIWRLDEPSSTSQRFQRELWGKANLYTLEEKFVSINSAIEKARNGLREMIEECGMSDVITRGHKNVQIGSTNTAEFRDQAARIQNSMSISKIVELVRKKGPELETTLTYIENTISKLRRMCENAYESEHQVPFSRVLTTEQVQSLSTSLLLQTALESRYASDCLYQSCRERRAGAMTLDIDVIDDNGIDLNTAASRNSIIMRYHLLLPWPSQLRQGALEIVIKGPYEQEKAGSPDHRGFEDACSAASMKSTSQFGVQNPVQSSAVWSFRSYVPVEDEKIPSSNEERWRPLTNLLYDPDVPIALEETLSFPRSQRIFLAHKLVQCGLLISGTSWLAKLEDKVVKRTPRGPNNAYRFLLELTSDANPPGGSGGAISQHLFAVGILLLELGLGKVMKLHGWRRGNGRSYPTFKAYTPTGAEGGDGDIRTPEEWQLLLTITMGDDYTKATNYCLANKRTECWNQVNRWDLMPKEREQAFKEVLQEYYINAYQPMLALMKKIQRDEDG